MEVPTPMLTRRPSRWFCCESCELQPTSGGIGCKQIPCGSLDCSKAGDTMSSGECSVGKCSTEVTGCATKGFRAGLLEVRHGETLERGCC